MFTHNFSHLKVHQNVHNHVDYPSKDYIFQNLNFDRLLLAVVGHLTKLLKPNTQATILFDITSAVVDSLSQFLSLTKYFKKKNTFSTSPASSSSSSSSTTTHFGQRVKKDL